MCKVGIFVVALQRERKPFRRTALGEGGVEKFILTTWRARFNPSDPMCYAGFLFIIFAQGDTFGYVGEFWYELAAFSKMVEPRSHQNKER